MLSYVVRRVVIMIPTMLVISILVFLIIQLPPGDFLSNYVARLIEQDQMDIGESQIEAMRARYGLDQPLYVQYYKWITGILFRNDWGQSMEWKSPVKDLIWERIGLTMFISGWSILFSWLVSIPVGVYSATKQYSPFDYLMTFISFVGVGIPGFLLALIIMWLAHSMLGFSVGGLFSLEYITAPWSLDKFLNMLEHIWIPILIVAVNGTAGGIRTTRANLLDELHKDYVQTARAKGLKESKVIWKYPVRIALNPFLSTVGWSLAELISGATLVAMVLSLQTTGPMLLRALLSQDMYLAGSFLLLLSTMTVIGTFISDLILAWADPRIRMEG